MNSQRPGPTSDSIDESDPATPTESAAERLAAPPVHRRTAVTAPEPHAMPDAAWQIVPVLAAGLVASAEPAIAFTSLVDVCVPWLCEQCIVDLVEDGQHATRISRPTETPVQLIAPQSGSALLGRQSVTIDFAADGEGGDTFYGGTITCRRVAVAPDPALASLLQLLTRLVIEQVRRERLQRVLDAERLRFANLQRAST